MSEKLGRKGGEKLTQSLDHFVTEEGPIYIYIYILSIYIYIYILVLLQSQSDQGIESVFPLPSYLPFLTHHSHLTCPLTLAPRMSVLWVTPPLLWQSPPTRDPPPGRGRPNWSSPPPLLLLLFLSSSPSSSLAFPLLSFGGTSGGQSDAGG